MTDDNVITFKSKQEKEKEESVNELNQFQKKTATTLHNFLTEAEKEELKIIGMIGIFITADKDGVLGIKDVAIGSTGSTHNKFAAIGRLDRLKGTLP